MQTVKCEACQGMGRVQHPFSRRAGTVRCDACRGSGLTKISSSDTGIRWTLEAIPGADPGCEIRSGLGMADYVEPPARRPTHIVCSVVEGYRVGSTYTVETEQDGILITWNGVPVEEHDCFPDQYIVRLDRAMGITARKL